jgi:hypothetical protein
MGIFHRSPYFDYNSAEQENHVCVFSRIRGLPEIKLTWDFSGVNTLPRDAPGGEEVNKRRPRGQTSTGGGGLGHATPPIPVWASSLCCRLSSSSDAQLDLKTPI